MIDGINSTRRHMKSVAFFVMSAAMAISLYVILGFCYMSEVEHLFIYLRVIFMFFLVEYLFMS